jgi:hypothetical protein
MGPIPSWDHGIDKVSCVSSAPSSFDPNAAARPETPNNFSTCRVSPLYEGVPLGIMSRSPEYLDSDRSDHSGGTEIQVRDAPDEEDDDDEQDKDNDENEADEEDDEDGYSE